MSRIVAMFVLDTQQYLSVDEIDDYLAANPQHALIEVIVDESFLATSGSRKPVVKNYLREAEGDDLVELTTSGNDVLVKRPGHSNKSLSNKRDFSGRVQIGSSFFEVVHSFSYEGSDVEGEILAVACVVSADVSIGNTTTIRLYDSTNNQVLGETTVLSTGKRVIRLENLQNIPSDVAILEVQVKNLKKNKIATIYNVTLLF